MAKIGGSSKQGLSANKGATGKNSLGQSSNHEMREPDHLEGTLFWVTNRLEEYLAEHHGNFGIGYSGAFNVETATVEIRGARFEGCDHYDELTSECDSCGRTKDNNIRLLSGAGDGVYSGINYWAEHQYSEDDLNPELLGSFYLFDDGSAHSRGIDSRRWESPMPFFFQCAAKYSNLNGSIVGEIKAGDGGFWLSEARACHGSRDAQVNHWGSENREYQVLCFSEEVDSVDSGEEKGFSFRPRIVLILRKNIADSIFGEGELREIDWASQPIIWENMSVHANIGGGGNATACLNNDGIYWRTVLARHVQNFGSANAMFQRYQEQVLSLFLQGALLGDERSQGLLTDLLSSPETSQSDDATLSRALAARGWVLTDEARALASSAKQG